MCARWRRGLRDPLYLQLAALVDHGLREGMKRTTHGTGAFAWAIRESGLQVSESTARRAWRHHYPLAEQAEPPDDGPAPAREQE